MSFIKTCGTGQEIPDPPRYINFCRGDVDNQSEVSEDENYSVAQFSRHQNPAYRSSSPSHSNAESNFKTSQSSQPEVMRMSEERIMADDHETETPTQANSGRPAPLNFRQADPHVPPNYSPSQHGDIAQVPHNQFPTDGMTMFCRAGPPSVNGSNLSSNTRPESRDSQSEYSTPSSFTSADPMSGKNSPTKGMPLTNGVEMPGMANESPDRSLQKKRSGFFSNSPFRRKSRKEHEHPAHEAPSRNTWSATSSAVSSRINLNPSTVSSSSAHSSPVKSAAPRQAQNLFNRNAGQMAPEGEEPADPRANFQMNIGNNVFDVANPDSQSHQSTPKASHINARRGPFSPPAASAGGDDMSLDPIARALADLKQSSSGAMGMAKQASLRQPVDRYHGVATPTPDAAPASRPNIISAVTADRLAAQRGTPPPAYDGGRASALGVPQPAFTSREMRNRTENWGSGSVASGRGSQQAATRPGTRDGRRSPGPGMVPRAASPQPQNRGMVPRAASPNPQARGMPPRAASPNPQARGMPPRAASPNPQFYHQATRARSPAPDMMRQQGPPNGQYRAASPNPYGGGRPRGHSQAPPTNRQGSGMEMQLASSDVQRYDAGGSGRSRQGMVRPSSAYGGDSNGMDRGRGDLRRERSKSMAAVPHVLHYGKSYPPLPQAVPKL